MIKTANELGAWLIVDTDNNVIIEEFRSKVNVDKRLTELQRYSQEFLEIFSDRTKMCNCALFALRNKHRDISEINVKRDTPEELTKDL